MTSLPAFAATALELTGDDLAQWATRAAWSGPSLADPYEVCDQAESLVRQGREAWALKLFRALAVDARCPTALLPRVAAGLAGLGDHASALDACRETARREPGQPEALFGVALSMKRLGFPASLVIPIADRVVELAPSFLPARTLLAAALIEAGRPDEADDVLRDAPGCTPGGACRVGRMLAWLRSPGGEPA